MDRKKVTVKGVDTEAWEILLHLRQVEQRFCGAILSDCIREYYACEYEEEEDGDKDQLTGSASPMGN